jgi:group I intron endonuclease
MLVYKITNTVNGKAYIGVTIRTLHNRWTRHKSSAKTGSQHPIHKAIRKHGADKFITEELCTVTTIEDLKQREQELIALFETYGNPAKGYNATRGGDGTWGKQHTPETRERIRAGLHRARQEGRFLNEAWLEACQRARKKQIGIPLTTTHRSNISNALRGRKKNDGAGKQPISVDQYTTLGEYVRSFAGYGEAARAVGSNPSDIMRACQGKRKTVKGYKFKWTSL